MTTESTKITGYKTVSLDMASWYDPKYKFTVGKTHTVSNSVKDGQSCGRGLHFCQNQYDLPLYNGNHSEHIVLLVEADEADVLGSDGTKTRVSKLKVVKEYERVERFNKEFLKALEHCKKLVEGLGSPATVISSQKVQALFAPIKAANIAVKGIRVFSNEFELEHWVNQECVSFNLNTSADAEDKVATELSYSLPFTFKELGFSVETSDNCNVLFAAYCEAHSDKKKTKLLASRKAYVEMLALGLVPLGYTNKNVLVVYQPEVVKATKKPSKKAGK